MIIYTGRFQPFHNGHLEFIKRVTKTFPDKTLCIAIVRDVPFSSLENDFDVLANQQFGTQNNPFDAETTLTLINSVLSKLELPNIVTTLMPRATQETWPIIRAMFDCERTWLFTNNMLQKDDWERKKVEFYQEMGETIIRLQIEKSISGTDVRRAMRDSDLMALKKLVPTPIFEYIKLYCI